MVHSPTDDLFSAQQWEHWAMVFVLVLGLIVGYGQAAAEDRRRAQRRSGGTGQPRRRRSRHRATARSGQQQPSRQQYSAQSRFPERSGRKPISPRSGPAARPSKSTSRIYDS